ncbi:hypothetical protein [Streptomyces sp. NPDC047065]|uniref:hypothetical protein n=1 Tax=Streptomyces sp. NPDC047065 TaxID=3154606 RepID=UPI0033F1022D
MSRATPTVFALISRLRNRRRRPERIPAPSPDLAALRDLDEVAGWARLASALSPPTLSAADYAPETDVVRDLMAELLDVVASRSAEHAPNGSWEPRRPDALSLVTEAADLLDDLSRVITRTRRGLRAVDERARTRFYDRAVRIPSPRLP